MIQRFNLMFKCQQNDHNDDIDMVCYNKVCKESRLNCFKCIKMGMHQSHIHDVEKIHTILEFIDKQNKECDKLIECFNSQVESMNQSYSKLISGIRNKYSLPIERLVYLNSKQINDFLNSIIEFFEYKQSITTTIQEQTKKLTKNFDSLYQQLQLSTFNYHQHDDTKLKLSKDLYDKGYQLYSESKFKEAIEILDQSLKQNPNNHLSSCCKGHCLRELNKHNESIKFFDQALSFDQNHFFSLIGKGKCLQDQSKYKEALDYYEKSLKINPNDGWTKNQRDFCKNKVKQ